jgi:Fe-S cluster assembly ATP-binding protein
MKNLLLNIQNLKASINNKEIIKDLGLQICEDEIHVIMGPNGSGKSTLSKIISGHPSYNVTDGSIEFLSKNLFDLSPEERSHEGIFLAFQYPLEISGVTNYDFLCLAYNEKQKSLKKEELTPLEFFQVIEKYLKELKMSQDFLGRNLNEGFSGGEKKKNEILQLLLLKPKLILLDELDSGVDIDAIKTICETLVNNREKGSSILLITHYPRILNYLKPNYIHIMRDGKIIKTGSTELIEKIEQDGYDNII